MIDCIEKDDVSPVSPHCHEVLETVWCRALSSMFGKRHLYFCPKCRKVIGVSRRKGFGWDEGFGRSLTLKYILISVQKLLVILFIGFL
jgi:hypothetical protein